MVYSFQIYGTTFFFNEINDLKLDIWFQPDETTCQTERETLTSNPIYWSCYLAGGDMDWPPRSSGLTPLDFSMGLFERKVLCQ